MSKLINDQNIAFIVYQMGKVGSSTMTRSLSNMHGRQRVLHIHGHKTAKECIEKWRERFDSVIVVTGFREPLSRCISAYFQNFTVKRSHWFVGQQADVRGKRVDWLIGDFNAKVVPHLDKTIDPWLANYERTVDCKLAEFTQANGYMQATQGNVHCYIYKLEELTEFQQGVSDDQFLSKVELVNSNVSRNKWYASIYSGFKKAYRISQMDYDALYGSLDFVQRLYGDHELRDLANNFILDLSSELR